MTDSATGAPAAARLIVVSNDGVEYVLGRPDLGIYVAVPEPGAAFVRALIDGESVPEATIRASAVAGEPVDGADFMAALSAAGLFGPAGEAGADASSSRGGPRWWAGVRPERAAWLFGRVAWCCYGIAVVAVLVLLRTRPEVRPNVEHLWFLPDPVWSSLALLPIAVLLTALHEAGHWLAGRAAGVPAAFRVSHRGIFVVFETDLTQIVALPRRRRYGPFLAGMAFDVVVLAAVLGLRSLNTADVVDIPGFADRLLAAVAILVTTSVVWQWTGIFLRTDVYAVLANALRCHNLYRATWLTVKDRLVTLTDAERDELEAISEHDRRVARWFGLLYAAGLVAQTWWVLRIFVPYLIAMGSWIVDNVTSLAVTSGAFWSCVLAALFVAARYGLPPLLALRERRLRSRGVLL